MARLYINKKNFETHKRAILEAFADYDKKAARHSEIDLPPKPLANELDSILSDPSTFFVTELDDDGNITGFNIFKLQNIDNETFINILHVYSRYPITKEFLYDVPKRTIGLDVPVITLLNNKHHKILMEKRGLKPRFLGYLYMIEEG